STNDRGIVGCELVTPEWVDHEGGFGRDALGPGDFVQARCSVGSSVTAGQRECLSRTPQERALPRRLAATVAGVVQAAREGQSQPLTALRILLSRKQRNARFAGHCIGPSLQREL